MGILGRAGHNIHFYIPLIISKEFGWAGIGLKLPEEGRSMMGADIVNIIFQKSITDCIALSNEKPTVDVKNKGSDDLIIMSPDPIKGHMVYSWKRRLDTGDVNDKVLIKGNEYTLLWALGKMNGGFQTKHFKLDRGFDSIILSDDYFDDSILDLETQSFLSQTLNLPIEDAEVEINEEVSDVNENIGQ